MEQAVKLGKEIQRKVIARTKTKSPHLKTDYRKSITRDYNELAFYCRMKGIDLNEVWKIVCETVC